MDGEGLLFTERPQAIHIGATNAENAHHFGVDPKAGG
jgi:hypothetical protein